MRRVIVIATILLLAAGAALAWPLTHREPRADAVSAAPAGSAAPTPAATPTAAPTPTAPASPGAKPAANTFTHGPAALVERQPDGSVRLDHRFTLIGTGSRDDPYKVTWDLLGSAAETFKPEDHRTELPDRVVGLGGGWVEISGYMAPPLQTEETKELLVMLNRWDGCCIGRPPTPFDSIEASLRNALPLRGKHLIRYGTIRGRLEVDPFLAGPVILGIYRLEDAEVIGEPNQE